MISGGKSSSSENFPGFYSSDQFDFTPVCRYCITVFRLFKKRDTVTDTMKSRKILWHTRDMILALLLVTAILALLHSTGTGLQSFIAATDKPSQTYGDFCEYYYPAGRMIAKLPQPLGGYFYTPSFALLLPLFTPDSVEDAMFRWQIFQHTGIFLLLIVPAVWLAGRGGRKIWFFLYILIFLTSFSLWHNLKWGQMSVLITIASIAALILHERRCYWSAVLLLAAASLVKYYPALMIFYFLIRREFGFIARFIVCMLVFGLLFPAAMLGMSNSLEFYRLVNAEMAYALDWVAFDPNSQFFANVLVRLAGISPESGLRGFLSLPGLIICLAVFRRLYRLQPAEKCDPLLAPAGIFLLIPFLINTSWPHYFVYLPFCATLFLQNCSSRFQQAAIILAVVLQSCLIFPFTGYLWYSSNGLLLFANLVLLAIWFKKTTPGSDLAGRNPEVS